MISFWISVVPPKINQTWRFSVSGASSMTTPNPSAPEGRAVDANVNTNEIIVAQLALARSVSAASTCHCG
jgi:hypothetical protein